MKLFLCSSFITQETKPDFEKLIGRECKGLKIACIITAAIGYKPLIEARGEKWDLSWLEKEISNFEQIYGFAIDQYDINTMTEGEIDSLYSNYDGIWVYGGITSFLLKAIYDKNFKSILLRFANEKFYIGSSAGSMICSEQQDASEWYIGEPDEDLSNLPGLALIPFQIYPHYKESELNEILSARHSEQEYWLIKDGQAIACDGDVFVICGGGATIIKESGFTLK